ncbi:hypothetical protein TTHERM_000593068 (macronuclear) [Tetrahymena thermophila SB210]|uniref:Uncharacterized protein n=1 Tax=Tetrahymena thermophila (strain SB210) TaxID=312017 RepID=W7XDF2_TETTS|nr:hypothetical protein TTHERM_000593068 [Tetrahymena thermophila SB210]EWS75572.1 hypothetical protein TTHERM_000593068 [Tetrahymena thermophila SB210]|eukprot:XP_012651872.1 hypothetical protein TTHERM_000593068 [Tetrahymena thermophila SB210]
MKIINTINALDQQISSKANQNQLQLYIIKLSLLNPKTQIQNFIPVIRKNAQGHPSQKRSCFRKLDLQQAFHELKHVLSKDLCTFQQQEQYSLKQQKYQFLIVRSIEFHQILHLYCKQEVIKRCLRAN